MFLRQYWKMADPTKKIWISWFFWQLGSACNTESVFLLVKGAGHVKLLRSGVGVCTCGFLSQDPLLCPFWPLRLGHMMECDRGVVEGEAGKNYLTQGLKHHAEDWGVCPGALGNYWRFYVAGWHCEICALESPHHLTPLTDQIIFGDQIGQAFKIDLSCSHLG